MARKVWFQLVDEATHGAYADTQTTSVSSDGVNDIDDLRKAVWHYVKSSLPSHLIAANLRVYANRAAYVEENAQPLKASASVNELGTDEDGALIVEVPTRQSGGAIVSAVSPSENERRFHMFNARIEHSKLEHEGGVPSTYTTYRTAGVASTSQEMKELINASVEVPKLTRKRRRSEESILDQLETLQVAEVEFQLEALSDKQESENPIVMTPGLHAFWKGYGDFPSSYFVRKEEVMFWQVVKGRLPTVGKKRIVMVGSPGVGKSCFLMLVGFYMACVKKEKVLIIRRVKEGDVANVVVYLDGQGSFARAENVSPVRLDDVRQEARGALVLVDGYSQAYVDAPASGLLPFHLLATSCQYDAKQDDPSHVVVLPAWRRDDLEMYARLTDWVISAGFRKTKNLKDSTWPKLVKEQYFYSGGSLRGFCETRENLKKRVVADCKRVGNAQAYQLVYAYGGDRSNDQVDRVRRHYITDRDNDTHYSNSVHWDLSVDSGYALKLLGRHVSMEKQLEVFNYAESIGAGFLGTAYELLLHHAVHEAYAKKTPVVLKMNEGSYYERIQICVPHVKCCGENEDECYTFVANLSERTYWHPDYPFFPFIDAVVMCEAFRSGSNDPEVIVAYIQATIRNEKTFKPHRLRKLNEAMNKNRNLANCNRAFVVVVPESTICETFTLHNAPKPEEFLTMVSCFDPNQFARQFRA